MFDFLEEGLQNYILYRDRKKVEYESVEFEKYIYDKNGVAIGIQVVYTHCFLNKELGHLKFGSILMDDGKSGKLRVIWIWNG
jgi:hypothetical protein